MDENQYCILWNNYHTSLISTLGALQQKGDMVDVTIVCPDGQNVQAHQVVLAACSVFFRNFIKDNPSKHPIVLMPSEISYTELKAMIEFMYTGQVCVEQDKLQAFIKGARYLRIKGLEESGDDVPKEKDKSIQIDASGDDLKGKDGAASKRAKYSSNGMTERLGEDMDTHYDSDDIKDKWEVVDRTAIVFPSTNVEASGKRKRRRGISLRKRPVALGSNIVFYEKKKSIGGSGPDGKVEPINKIRRVGFTAGHEFDDEVDMCTCTSRKIWSVQDLENLLKAWKETLSQVPPSYFIRSVSLCRSVAKRLQQKGVKKNWRQCQVKMKNLRREVRLYKETEGESKANNRKPSEVANACEQLLPFIEDIFDKEEEIRQKWYKIREEKERDGALIKINPEHRDILAQVAGLADSDICDDDQDITHIERDVVHDVNDFTEPEGQQLDTQSEIISDVQAVTEIISSHHQESRMIGDVQTVTEIMSEPNPLVHGIRVHTVTVHNEENDDDDGLEHQFVSTIDVPPHHTMHTTADGTVHHIVDASHTTYPSRLDQIKKEDISQSDGEI